MRRIFTFLASLFIGSGLVACCCNLPFGNAPPAPPAPAAQGDPPPQKKPDEKPKIVVPRDPAVAAIEDAKGRVVYDDAQPDRPVVEVWAPFTKGTDADFRSLASFKKLRKLRIMQNSGINASSITGVGFKELADLQDLEVIDAAFVPITDEGMKHIAAFKRLKVLDINGARLTDAGIKDLVKLDKLEDLDAAGWLFSGKDKKPPSDSAIKEIAALKNLRRLHVHNSYAGDESAKAFAGLDQLREFHAYGTSITDVGMVELANCKQLEELKIGYGITDKGLKAFAGNTRLKNLSVWNNSRITDASVPILCTMTGLRELDIATSITDKGEAEIRTALPNCKIAKRK